jgi:hypothetical protein
MSFFLMTTKRAGNIPAISIALSDAAPEITQGRTIALTVTLTRVAYNDTVTPSVTGLPSGVSGSWSDSSLTGGETTTVLTLTATGGATVVTDDAFTITCSGAGVTDAIANATLTVYSSANNEPVGYTQAFSNPMSTVPPLGSSDIYNFQRFDQPTNHLSILSDGLGNESDSNYLRVAFPNGHPGGGVYETPFVAGSGFSSSGNKRELYWRCVYKISANWTDNGNTATKFNFVDQTNPGGGAPQNNHYINLTSLGTLSPYLAIQRANWTSGLGSQNYPPGLANVARKGKWNKLEVQLIANTVVPGVSEANDGTVRVWLNNALLYEYTTVCFFERSMTPRWTSFYCNPTYGGGSNPVPQDQNIDIDHWYVSTKA